jgi:hypothetical protein
MTVLRLPAAVRRDRSTLRRLVHATDLPSVPATSHDYPRARAPTRISGGSWVASDDVEASETTKMK